jgi:hypothetical protein
MTKTIEDHREEAQALYSRKKIQEDDFSELMKNFVTKLIKAEFPGITNLAVSYNYKQTGLGIDWDLGPTADQLEDFLDELNETFKFNKL